MRLRVKGSDLIQHQILVGNAKGGKERVTILPNSVSNLLRTQSATAKQLHEQNLAGGDRAVGMLYALQRKYRRANDQPVVSHLARLAGDHFWP